MYFAAKPAQPPVSSAPISGNYTKTWQALNLGCEIKSNKVTYHEVSLLQCYGFTTRCSHLLFGIRTTHISSNHFVPSVLVLRNIPSNCFPSTVSYLLRLLIWCCKWTFWIVGIKTWFFLVCTCYPRLDQRRWKIITKRLCHYSNNTINFCK